MSDMWGWGTLSKDNNQGEHKELPSRINQECGRVFWTCLDFGDQMESSVMGPGTGTSHEACSLRYASGTRSRAVKSFQSFRYQSCADWIISVHTTN